MGDIQTTNAVFYNDIREIILNARSNAVRSVEFTRLMMYWYLGERIFVEEQRGQNRAEYGDYLIRDLSKKIEAEIIMTATRNCRMKTLPLAYCSVPQKMTCWRKSLCRKTTRIFYRANTSFTCHQRMTCSKK